MVRMTENDLRKQQVGGFYRDLELNPSYMQETEAQKKEENLKVQHVEEKIVCLRFLNVM